MAARCAQCRAVLVAGLDPVSLGGPLLCLNCVEQRQQRAMAGVAVPHALAR